MSARKPNPDYIVDIDQLRSDVHHPAPAVGTGEAGSGGLRGRPWLAVLWKCCRVYSRVYRNAEGTLYTGQCPKCGRRTRARVGPNGVSARFFEAQ